MPLSTGFTDTNLPAGIYFAVITSGNSKTVKKVVIL
jgi:hypothetical protein